MFFSHNFLSHIPHQKVIKQKKITYLHKLCKGLAHLYVFFDVSDDHDHDCDGSTAFHCNFGGCIDKSRVCDFHTDCPLREDEGFICGQSVCAPLCLPFRVTFQHATVLSIQNHKGHRPDRVTVPLHASPPPLSLLGVGSFLIHGSLIQSYSICGEVIGLHFGHVKQALTRAGRYDKKFDHSIFFHCD